MAKLRPHPVDISQGFLATVSSGQRVSSLPKAAVGRRILFFTGGSAVYASTLSRFPWDEQRTVCAAVSQSVGICQRLEGHLVGTEVRDTILVPKELPVSWEVGHTGSFPAVKLLLSLLGYRPGLIRGKKGLEIIHIYRNYGTSWVILGKSLNLLAVSFFVYKRRELD